VRKLLQFCTLHSIADAHLNIFTESFFQLQLAVIDAVFDHTSFHRLASGQLKPRHFRTDGDEKAIPEKRSRNRGLRSTVMAVQRACPPMEISDETKCNLGKVGDCPKLICTHESPLIMLSFHCLAL
jgi:hypothetical protein